MCNQIKTSHLPPLGLLYPLPIPHCPWSHLSLDFVTGLPSSQGNTTIFIIVDRFSKAARFITLPKLPPAKETAELITTHIFRVFGISLDIVSDRGPQFSSRFWQAFCQSLGTKVSLSSGFHPESNGQTERVNQDLESTLRCMVGSNPSSWSSYLIWAEYAHNTLRSSSTGRSPFSGPLVRTRSRPTGDADQHLLCVLINGSGFSLGTFRSGWSPASCVRSSPGPSR